MVKSLTNYYMLDFETLNEIEDCRVWSWASCSLKDTNKIDIGLSIESFFEWLSSKKKLFVYFHNLKFDGGFIDNYLLHQGFDVKENRKFLTPNSFTTSISAMGQWYSIEIMFENGNRATIYDSLKKLPFKVKEIAKAFKLKMAKGEIDYDKFRPIGYQLTDEEIDYIEKDVKIVAEALKIQFKEGMEALTVSKDCLNDYIATIGGENSFRNLFPVLSNALHENLKLAYRGGWTYASELFAEKIIGKGQSFDYNSLYPSQMKEQLMPYGLPISFNGKYKENKRFPLYIQHLRCEFELKKDHLPTIQIKGDKRFKASEYLKSSQGFEQLDLYLTNIDLELFLDHYDVYNLTYVQGFMFKAKKGMFDKYINKHMYVKENSGGALRSLAKLKMNGLYGKFGSDIDVTGKLPYLKKDGSTGYRKKSVVEVTLDDGSKVMKDCEHLKDYQEPIYIPVAIFTTSYGRDKTIRASQSVYHRFCYADTDSIHITGLDTPKQFDEILHDSKIGYLKRENVFTRALFLRAKTYMEEVCIKYQYENGEIKVDEYGDEVFKHVSYEEMETTILDVKCAGLDDQAKPYVNFENFYIGSHIDVPDHAKKLRPRHVKGGIVLEKKEINIRAQMFLGR